MAHLGVVGTAIQSSSEDEVTLTLDQAVPVDATILLAIAWDSPSPGGVPTISSVTDTGDNSWTTTPDASVNAGVTVAVAILRTRVTTELDQGDTITVTIDDARGRWCMQADAFDDVVASPLDETTSSDGSSSVLSTGTTGTTSTPHQLLYAAFGFGGGRDVTVPEGWTGAGKLETSAGSGNRALQVTHRYVAATGAYEATLTLSTSSTYAAAMGTYEIDPPDPEARLSQLRIQAPNPGEAKLARLSQLALVAPQAKVGEARLSQLRIEAPAGEGQPYTGLKIARDGAWWNSGVYVLE